MKKMFCLFVVVFCFGILACNTGNSNRSEQGIQNNIELFVEPGERWQRIHKFLFIPMKRAPQLAAWIEDENGNYVSTISVTGRSARNNWMSAPEAGRPEALPVWNHKRQTASKLDNLDTVSTASPKGSVEVGIADNLLIDGNTYNVYLEVNHSYDYNDVWTENISGVNGQPSVIYHAEFIVGVSGEINLVPIGHGSVDGLNGNITFNLETLTTALHIVKNAILTVK